jgi:hypothetical protein
VIAVVLVAGLVVGMLIGARAAAAQQRIEAQIAADTRDTLVDGEAELALDEDAQAGAL